MASFSSPTVRKKLKATVPSNPQPSEEIDLVPAEGGTQLALVDAAKSSKRGREDNNEVELRSQTELALSDFASGIFRRSGLGSSHVFECRFRSHFGASPGVAARCWDLLQEGELTDLHTMDRFLWALMLLMNYATEEVNAIKASGVDKGTFSKWAWDFVERIADLESVVVSDASCCLFVLSLLLLRSYSLLVWLTRCPLPFPADCLGESKAKR